MQGQGQDQGGRGEEEEEVEVEVDSQIDICLSFPGLGLSSKNNFAQKFVEHMWKGMGMRKRWVMQMRDDAGVGIGVGVRERAGYFSCVVNARGIDHPLKSSQ